MNLAGLVLLLNSAVSSMVLVTRLHHMCVLHNMCKLHNMCDFHKTCGSHKGDGVPLKIILEHSINC